MTLPNGDAPQEFGPHGQSNEDMLRPLSNDVISEVLRARDYYFYTDSDGDIGGKWGETTIFFFVAGARKEIINIRARARRDFTIEDVPRLYSFCNSWNNDKFWPKAYVHVFDNGIVVVYGENVTDLEHGVTLRQLHQLISCGISTGCSLSRAVDELP